MSEPDVVRPGAPRVPSFFVPVLIDMLALAIPFVIAALLLMGALIIARRAMAHPSPLRPQ